MNWYYVDAGQQAGPVSDEQLDGLRASGKINDETLVWREGLAEWQPLRIAKPATIGASGAQSAPSLRATAPGAVCAECGRMFDVNDMIRHGEAYICANCKPVFMQKLAEGAKIETGALNYAGFWIRVGAKIVDGIILGLVLMIPIFIAGMGLARGGDPEAFESVMLISQLGYYIVWMAYSVFFIGKYGATPGKMVCKIKVVMADGSPVSYGRATGRFFGEVLSGMVCYIGYIMVAFDKVEKRALHDHICNTRVVYK